MIDHLIWVAPPHVNTGYCEEAFSQLQQTEGVSCEELAGFAKASGGWIEGRLLGLDITICSYPQLEVLPLPVDSLIDIDTDYFVTVPGDEAWVDPRSVFEVLHRLPLNPELLTLSRSVTSGFMPLRYRFYSDYLAALFESRRQDAAHYERLFHLDRQLRAGENDAVTSGCQRELESDPQCAATYYLHALAEPDPERANHCQRQAADLCSSYRPNVLRSACEILNRRLPAGRRTALALEEQLTRSQASPEQQALARAALGLICCMCGHVGRALTHYERCAEHFGCHPELALEIGKLLLQSGQAERAIPFLEAALQDDKNRATAHVFLAHCNGMRGSMCQALQHLETAHEMTPAWGDVLRMLAEIHQQLGNERQSQTAFERYHTQRSKAAALAEKLSDRGD